MRVIEGRLAIILPLFVVVVANQGSQAIRGQINPSLHPESDKKFFGKDYPDDLRPKVVNQFDHPYPTVQDSGEYDKDYVKDENNDNGEWTAQMEYDQLKNKLARDKEETLKAKAKMEEEQWEWEQVKKFEQAAEDAAKKAERDSANAAGDAANAEGAAGDSAGGIDSEAKELEGETDDLKGCEEELARAKKMLKQLEQEMSNAEDGAASAYGKYSKAEAYARQLEAQESSLEKKVDAEMLSYDQLVKMYKVAVKDLEELETDVDKAAKKLKEFQAKDPGAKDGVIGLNAKSGSSGNAVSSIALMFAVLSCGVMMK